MLKHLRTLSQVGALSGLTMAACLANAGQIPGWRDEAPPWPAAPDRFVWPEPSAASPSELAGEMVPTADLRAEIGEQALNHVESSWGDEALQVVRIDMNGDGVAELFVHERVLTGNGGRIFFLFHRDRDVWRPISQTMGWIALLDKVDGWVRYSVLSSGGAGYHTRALMEYCDGSYRMVRSEVRDSRLEDLVVKTSRCEDAEPSSM
jgi:hypothetical protein